MGIHAIGACLNSKYTNVTSFYPPKIVGRDSGKQLQVGEFFIFVQM